MNFNHKLSIVHPDTIECVPITPPSLFKMHTKCSIPEHNSSDEEIYEQEIKEQSYYNDIYYDDNMDMEEEMKENAKRIKLTEGETFYVRKPEEVKDKVGYGEMYYIKDKNIREMCTNAWKAITFSNNWDFVAQDIDSFIWSNDSRINEIANKMEELGYDSHSGCSFGYTMRMMQFLVKNGEDKFKNLFEKQNDAAITKFLDYSSGF
jgi:hypothetical protein